MGLNGINKTIKIIKITKKQSYIFNNNIMKAFCMAQFGHTFKAFVIIIKRPSYLLKIIH